jgi:hypothetical protein
MMERMTNPINRKARIGNFMIFEKDVFEVLLALVYSLLFADL